MNVAETFGDKSKNILHLNATALYALSAPSMPDEVRTEIIERIENGEEISSREIQRLKKEAAEAIAAKQTIEFALTEKQKRLDWLEMDKKAIHEQNDRLRNEIAYKVDAKAEAKAAEMKAQIYADIIRNRTQ